jgi:cell division cycle 14
VKRVNSAFLICAYGVIVMGKTGMEAWGSFQHLEPFPDYRDASLGSCTYKCSLLHCLRGLEIAIKLGWLDYAGFNLEEYEKLEKVENGDMNWIIPGKMLAFSCPSVSATDESGMRCFTPEDYGPEFKRLGVGSVIRLNKTTYDSAVSG